MRIEGSMTQSYERLSSMQRINRAADDAAGLAISQKLKEQINGLDRGTSNTQDMNNLAKTAEGSLSSIHDSLHRMRELAVQASNGTLTSEDKAMLQTEIDEIKASISDTVRNTQFNTIKVLDGTFSDKNVAIDPSGKGMKMSIQNTGLTALGIDSFDVTGSFDISDIDSALEKVSDARANLGATSNRLDHAVNTNRIAEYNQIAANSRIEDLDIGLEIMQLNTQQIVNQYQYYAQKQSAQQKANSLSLLG
ncbi:MAG: flagellin [Bacillota bacterium]